jgi:hypothetical protein
MCKCGLFQRGEGIEYILHIPNVTLYKKKSRGEGGRNEKECKCKQSLLHVLKTGTNDFQWQWLSRV